MAAIQLSNNLGLAPPKAKPSIQPLTQPLASQQQVEPPPSGAIAPSQNSYSSLQSSSLQSSSLQSTPQHGLQTQFAFELPTGYVDSSGQLHRQGIMRLALTIDEIEPMSDPRVQANPAYATVIILSRVILSLGSLIDISPITIEGLFAGDLNYLQNFYRQINGLLE